MSLLQIAFFYRCDIGGDCRRCTRLLLLSLGLGLGLVLLGLLRGLLSRGRLSAIRFASRKGAMRIAQRPSTHWRARIEAHLGKLLGFERLALALGTLRGLPLGVGLSPRLLLLEGCKQCGTALDGHISVD